MAALTIGQVTNCTLTYQSGGVHKMKVRCNKLVINYSVNSEESHARRTRAFYPHLRNVGSFSLSLQFITWSEYNLAMNWFQQYSDIVLSAKVASAMRVSLPSRNFSYLGVPTKGITFGDHTGSMVFAPTIEFITVSSPLDVKKAKSASGASYTNLRQGQTSTTWFYPESIMNQPGALQNSLYDVGEATGGKNDEVNNVVNPPPGNQRPGVDEPNEPNSPRFF